MSGQNIDVKICGLTSLADACAALDAGADFLGFVLFPGSKRALTPSALARIADKLPRQTRLIGVFVDQAPTLIEQVAVDCRLYAAQLHGDECSEDYTGLTVPVWRAFRMVDGMPRPAPGEWRADRFVMDAASTGLEYGGTGRTADWGAAARLARDRPLMLAGGLNPGNIARAIKTVRPLGVDVAGGVERAPGIKDVRLMREFIDAARAAGEAETI